MDVRKLKQFVRIAKVLAPENIAIGSEKCMTLCRGPIEVMAGNENRCDMFLVTLENLQAAMSSLTKLSKEVEMNYSDGVLQIGYEGVKETLPAKRVGESVESSSNAHHPLFTAYAPLMRWTLAGCAKSASKYDAITSSTSALRFREVGQMLDVTWCSLDTVVSLRTPAMPHTRLSGTYAISKENLAKIPAILGVIRGDSTCYIRIAVSDAPHVDLMFDDVIIRAEAREESAQLIPFLAPKEGEVYEDDGTGIYIDAETLGIDEKGAAFIEVAFDDLGCSIEETRTSVIAHGGADGTELIVAVAKRKRD